MVLLGVTAALAAVMFWIISNSIAKRVVGGLGFRTAAFLVTVIGIVPAILATLLVGAYAIPVESVVISLVAGIAIPIGFWLSYFALRTEKLSNTAPLGELQPAILVLFGIVVLGESFSLIQMVCVIAIFSGAMLVLTTEGLRLNMKLVPAILSNVCWIVYWIMMTYAIGLAHTYALPILFSRLAAFAGAAILLAMYGRPRMDLRWQTGRLTRNRAFMVLIMLAVIMALADASGDVVFGITLGANAVAIGGAIMALMPMFVAFSGFLLYRERLNGLQSVGLMMMIVGALALSLA